MCQEAWEMDVNSFCVSERQGGERHGWQRGGRVFHEPEAGRSEAAGRTPGPGRARSLHARALSSLRSDGPQNVAKGGNPINRSPTSKRFLTI